MARYRVAVRRTFEQSRYYTLEANSELEAKREAERQDIVAWGNAKGIYQIVALPTGGKGENLP